VRLAWPTVVAFPPTPKTPLRSINPVAFITSFSGQGGPQRDRGKSLGRLKCEIFLKTNFAEPGPQQRTMAIGDGMRPWSCHKRNCFYEFH